MVYGARADLFQTEKGKANGAFLNGMEVQPWRSPER